MEQLETNEMEELKEIDDALNEDRLKQMRLHEEQEQQKKVEESKAAMLPKLLRYAGGGLLISASAAFLMQHWGESDHVLRYGYFLLFSIVLAATAFLSGIRMHDDKGARTLLAVLAAIIPVHFCQLGALLFSGLIGTGIAHNYPSYAYYHANSLGEAALAIGIALPVLFGLIYVSFLSLVRSQAFRLGLIYTALNAALLIPTRDVDIIAVIALGIFACIIQTFFTYKDEAAIRTREGFFVKVMMTVPLLLLLGRTYNLYFQDLTMLFVSANFAILSVASLAGSRKVKQETLAAFVTAVSLIFAVVSWECFAYHMNNVFQLSDSLRCMIMTFPLCGLALAVSSFSKKEASAYRSIAALMLLGSSGFQLISFPEITSSIACIVAAIPIFCYGYLQKEAFLFIGGLLTFAFGILYQLRFAMELYTFSPWLSLAIVGIITILVSSYIEMHKGQIVGRYKELRAHFSVNNA